MSRAGSASRRGGATYAAYHEPQPAPRPSAVVDALLIVSVFVIAAALMILVLQI